MASLLGIRHIRVAIDKMDLVDWSEAVYERIAGEYTTFAEKLQDYRGYAGRVASGSAEAPEIRVGVIRRRSHPDIFSSRRLSYLCAVGAMP